jgi:hypothetical protein
MYYLCEMSPLEKKLHKYSVKVKNAQPSINKGIREILNKNKTFLKDLNTSQLIDGLDETGAKIGDSEPYRSNVYATYKNDLNPLAGIGNPDLNVTGDYWESITAIIKGRVIQMFAKDPKAPVLSHYNGIGIADYNYKEISDLIRRFITFKL